MKTSITLGASHVAIRMENAYNGFLANLMEIAGIGRAEAAKVADAYRAAKVVKMDAVGGRMTVKHGAYLDRENILHALSTLA